MKYFISTCRSSPKIVIKKKKKENCFMKKQKKTWTNRVKLVDYVLFLGC